jgi:phage gp36-like protein
MPYIYADLDYLKAWIDTRHLVMLTNDDDTVDETDSDNIDETILMIVENAMAYQIDGFLKTTHTVPFTTIPDQIKQLTSELVEARLWRRRSKGDEGAITLDNDQKARLSYIASKMALEQLTQNQKIAKTGGEK